MRPSSDDLFFERFLLTEGAGWQQGQSQHRDCRDAENTTPIHWIPPLSIDYSPCAKRRAGPRCESRCSAVYVIRRRPPPCAVCVLERSFRHGYDPFWKGEHETKIRVHH